MEEGISILIPAYKAEKFIEECLDSIENQTYFKNNNNFEVLVGVDACQDTLNKLKNIRSKYRNLRIFLMERNKGTYITINTLFDIYKYKYVIIFGADDVMKLHMVETIMKYAEGFDGVRFRYTNFKGNFEKINEPSPVFSHGVVMFTDKLIKKFGGYMPWRIAADTELIKRMDRSSNIKKINEELFWYRIHDDNISKKKETGQNSEMRKFYMNMILDWDKVFNREVYIDKVIHKLITNI